MTDHDWTFRVRSPDLDNKSGLHVCDDTWFQRYEFVIFLWWDNPDGPSNKQTYFFYKNVITLIFIGILYDFIWTIRVVVKNVTIKNSVFEKKQKRDHNNSPDLKKNQGGDRPDGPNKITIFQALQKNSKTQNKNCEKFYNTFVITVKMFLKKKALIFLFSLNSTRTVRLSGNAFQLIDLRT